MTNPELLPQYLRSNEAPEPRTLIDILYDTAARFPEATGIDDGEFSSPTPR